jgi:hypothetical protein
MGGTKEGELVLAPSWSWGDGRLERLLAKEDIRRVWLRLPRGWQDAIDSVIDGARLEEVVEDIAYIDAMDEMEKAIFGREWGKALEVLAEHAGKREVICYRDPMGQFKDREHCMEMLTLTLKGRIFPIKVEEWRAAVKDETEDCAHELREEVSLLSECKGRELCLAPGLGMEMFLEGVRHLTLGHGPRQPLDRLRLEFMRASMYREEPSDEAIASMVGEHLVFIGMLETRGAAEAFGRISNQ